MAKTEKDWKDEAKALREKVKKLRAKLESGAARAEPAKKVKAPNPVSPLAPKGEDDEY